MIQFITDGSDSDETLQQVEAALAGGIRWIQIRMKNASEEQIADVAVHAVQLCRKADAVIIVDDHVELVKKCHLNGVHIGHNDMNPESARAILGPDYIIGFTVNNREDAMRAIHLPVDYIGVGPLRHTVTKKNLAPVLGIAGVSDILAITKATLPAVVIGGVTSDDIPALYMTGAAGVAVSGAIAHTSDKIAAARQFVSTDLIYKDYINNNIITNHI